MGPLLLDDEALLAGGERVLLERARHRHLPYLQRPLRGATLDDLDLDWVRKRYLPAAVDSAVLAHNQRPPEVRLASLRLASYDATPVPTALGALVCGSEPTRLLPQAYVQYVRFSGVNRATPILDQHRFDGPLPELVLACEAVLRGAIQVPTQLDGDLEARAPQYPYIALRELFRNAVLHRDYGVQGPIHVRWYSDRVEVISPGGPVPPLSPETLGVAEATAYRNPGLAEVMRNLGFVQRFGVGIAIARDELRRNRNPELRFRADTSEVVAVVRARDG